MKKNNIGVLITIILLLIVFLPGAVYGTYMHYKLEALGGNPNKDFYLEGKLYFYNGEKLLGTYTCETKKCGYAKNSTNNLYSIDKYNTKNDEIKIISNRYAFIEDGEKIILYDVTNGSNIIEYKEIKNYSVGINDNYYLVKNTNDLWGMLKIENNIKVAIPFEYDYLGLINNYTADNLIESEIVVAFVNDSWKLIRPTNDIIASLDYEIINYSNNFIVTKTEEKYFIYDYSNKEIMNSYNIIDVKLIEDVLIALTDNNLYLIYSGKTNKIIDSIISNNNEYEFTIENNSLIIKSNNEIVKTIALAE